MKPWRKVLVVDDSEIDHLTTKFTFEDFNSDIEVISAYDGQEALEILKTQSDDIDVIFLDINMPGMNGHQFLEVYSQTPTDQAVIVMLTSSDQKEDKDKCDQYDCVKMYINKPLELEDLESLSLQESTNSTVS